MEYDEDRELARYVWDHFADRMSEFERSVGRAIMGRQKANYVGQSVSPLLAVRWGRTDDPEINAALAEGPDVFRRRVCARVLNEAAHDLFVNRCARCRRVVRTPQARQCFWCGFDWHRIEP